MDGDGDLSGYDGPREDFVGLSEENSNADSKSQAPFLAYAEGVRGE